MDAGDIVVVKVCNCFLPCYKEKSGKIASDISAYKQKSITEFLHLMDMSTNSGCASVVATVMQQVVSGSLV